MISGKMIEKAASKEINAFRSGKRIPSYLSNASIYKSMWFADPQNRKQVYAKGALYAATAAQITNSAGYNRLAVDLYNYAVDLPNSFDTPQEVAKFSKQIGSKLNLLGQLQGAKRQQIGFLKAFKGIWGNPADIALAQKLYDNGQPIPLSALGRNLTEKLRSVAKYVDKKKKALAWGVGRNVLIFAALGLTGTIFTLWMLKKGASVLLLPPDEEHHE